MRKTHIIFRYFPPISFQFKNCIQFEKINPNLKKIEFLQLNN